MKKIFGRAPKPNPMPRRPMTPQEMARMGAGRNQAVNTNPSIRPDIAAAGSGRFWSSAPAHRPSTSAAGDTPGHSGSPKPLQRQNSWEKGDDAKFTSSRPVPDSLRPGFGRPQDNPMAFPESHYRNRPGLPPESLRIGPFGNPNNPAELPASHISDTRSNPTAFPGPQSPNPLVG